MTLIESVAKIAIFNEKAEILVLRRSDTHPSRPHWTDMPGGLANSGESENHTVVREAQEETGITLNPSDIKLFYTEAEYYSEIGKSVNKLFYFVSLEKTPAVKISWEHESYEWCTLDQLLARDDLQEFYRDGIKYAINHDLFTF
ncbi:MAG: NUDIX hydrolase [Candidatus Saccharimonadales bacterium]